LLAVFHSEAKIGVRHRALRGHFLQLGKTLEVTLLAVSD